MNLNSIFWVTLCATFFCTCGPTYLGAKNTNLMSGEETAKRAGDSASAAGEKGDNGVLVDSSEAFAQPTQTSKEPKVENAKIDGEGLYRTHCVACHGRNGEGGIAPSFAAQPAVNRAEIFHEIDEGNMSKGMPAWKSLLSHAEIDAVASYVIELKHHLTKDLPPKHLNP